MFYSKKISAIALSAILSISVALDSPYNVFADGVLTPDTTTGTDVPAIVWTWSDDNVSSGNCADGSAALTDCEGNQFCNDDPQFTGYDCVTNNGSCLDLNGDGIVTDWLGDGYCDDGAYGLVFVCEEFGFDCGDCTQTGPDPNGYCNEAPPVSCEEQGLVTCPNGACAASLDACPQQLLDCQGNPFDESVLSWIGDGLCDGLDLQYGLDFACPEYDCDGCDCAGTPGQSPACAAADQCGSFASVTPPVEDKVFYTFDNTPERIRPSYNVRTGVYDPGNMIQDRLISYLVSVTVNSGAYGGTTQDFDANTETITIVGLAEGDSACGVVITLDGAEQSPASCEACALAGVPTEGEPCDPQGGGGPGPDPCAEYDVTGDINNDESVNVLDIVSVVNHILGTLLEGCELEAGDLNDDSEINVLDIVSIVNIILGTGRTDGATSAVMKSEGNTLSISGNGYIGAIQMTLTHDANFSLDLTDNAMVAEYATVDNTTTLVVVAPESDAIFTASGSYDIASVLVANSSSYVTVIEPGAFVLEAAYPNPFNPSTSVSLSMPSEGYVSVKAYNLVGQVVGVLAEGSLSAGLHTMSWDASDLSSGVYLITAEYAGQVSTQKVMLMK